ncbi:hypothetical protein ACCN59_004800 [Salmonella enterica subsp. enterica]|nr:hypothetical protein [Salmonella enterica subsp. enterica serovar Eastbourne]
MLLTLAGLELRIKQTAPRKAEKVNFISYADDFVVTGASRELLENTIKPLIVAFLKERGLERSPEKTIATSISQGFDLLGFNIRKYRDNLLIKPIKNNVLTFIRNTRSLIKAHPTMATGELIRLLNPKLRGWGNYYRHSVAKQTFGYVDCQIFKTLQRRAKRRHPNKGARWVTRKYFLPEYARLWCFQGRSHLDGVTTTEYLTQLVTIPIKRHTKIRSEATPYDRRSPVTGVHGRKIGIKAYITGIHAEKPCTTALTCSVSVMASAMFVPY